MTETEESLYSAYPELCKYKDFVDSMKSCSRRIEFLSVRALLKDMLGFMPELFHNEDGKPYILEVKNISISHTKGYAAVILSDEKKVAIDIEYCSDRVCRIQNSYVRPDEFLTSLKDMLICWCSKETLYKLHSKDKLSFMEMRTDSLLPSVSKSDEGCFYIEDLRRNESIKMCFLSNEAYILTYAVEKSV